MNLVRNGKAIGAQSICAPIIEENLHAVVLHYNDMIRLKEMDAAELYYVFQDLANSFKTSGPIA